MMYREDKTVVGKISGTKENIYNVAFELFKEEGFSNVTVNQICAACKITKRTFYYHWASKEEILANLVDNTGIEAEQLVTELLSSKSITDVLWTIFEGFLKKDIELGPNITKQLFQVKLNREKVEDFPYDAKLFNTVSTLVKNAVANGDLVCKSTPEGLTLTLFHILRSITYTWAAQDGNFDLMEDSRRVFDAVIVSTK